MVQGKVKSFNKERGYGFISPLGGDEEVFVEDFFVRNSGVGDTGSRSLEQGEWVAYQLVQDRWGFTARNVCILKKTTPSVDRPEAVRVKASTLDKDRSLLF